MSEMWLPIEGYAGVYEISNAGRVKSLARKAKHAGGDLTLPERILKPTPRGGFLYASLVSDKKSKVTPIHYLVARAFIPNPDGKPRVIHKNGIHNDNRKGNLQWALDNEIIAKHDGWVEIDVSTKTFPDAVMKINTDDWGRMGRLKKRCYVDKRSRSARAIYVSIDIEKDKKTLVHRLLFPEAKYIDHINGDGLDNRRENIRACTHSQNLMNRPVQKNNRLGIKGVYQRTDTGRFVAKLKAGTVEYAEEFCTLDEAIAARKKAEELYFGEFNYKETKQ